MSKALSRVRALVSEIDAIQTGGRKFSSSVPLARAVDAVKALQADQVSQFHTASQTIPPMGAEAANVYPLNTAPAAATASPVTPATPEGKILIQMTGKIAVQLQMDDTDEIVEVRQLGEMIEIRFNDGKAIHLPLKNVA